MIEGIIFISPLHQPASSRHPSSASLQHEIYKIMEDGWPAKYLHTFGCSHLHSLTSNSSLFCALDCLENTPNRLYPNRGNTGSEQMTQKWTPIPNAIASGTRRKWGLVLGDTERFRALEEVVTWEQRRLLGSRLPLSKEIFAQKTQNFPRRAPRLAGWEGDAAEVYSKLSSLQTQGHRSE